MLRVRRGGEGKIRNDFSMDTLAPDRGFAGRPLAHATSAEELWRPATRECLIPAGLRRHNPLKG